MPNLWKRVLPILALVVLTACNLPAPRLVFDTPAPTLTPGPTATPHPTTIVTFTVHIPSSTPSGTAPALRIMDEVGGTNTTVILTSAGNDFWSGSTQAAVGAVLRYKYIRPLPTYVEEVTPARQTVPYRLLLVTGETVIAEDTVAAWTDTPFAGEVGALEGRVWNSNIGQGVMGVLVTAGGKVTVTAHDGSFVFFDLPVGVQRVTALAADGALRPAQGTASVTKGQMVALDLVSSDPNAVHVTFLVRPPAGTDARTILRLAGNVLQAGDTFVLDAHGSAIAAARQPALIPLADGRWTVSLLLYEGADFLYKYTLGDGAWNGELDVRGNKRLRRLIVPGTNALIDDTIVSWHANNSASVTFEAFTPADTPPDDNLAIQFRTDTWGPPLPMWRVAASEWRFVLYNPTDFNGSVFYRYCRNFACGAADDSTTAGEGAIGRFFAPSVFAQVLRDSIPGWQWLSQASPAAGVLPAVNVHAGFAAGMGFADEWRPSGPSNYVETFKAMSNAGANWVTFTRRGAALSTPGVNTPAYADDLAFAPLQADWSAMVSQAHTVGLRIALHPVTCHYTPYGACDYWNGVDYGGGFWNAWFAAYEKYLLTQAELARLSGTDLLVIGDFKLRPSLPGEPEAPADADARWRSLINNVRARYKGQIAFELLMGQAVWPNTPAFLDSVDVIHFSWWSPLAGSNKPSSDELAMAAGSLMDTQLFPIYQRFQKPLHISAAYYSADGAATQCLKREDGQCHAFEDFNPERVDVARYGLDLQEQADIYNALLTAVNGRPWVAGFSAFGYNPVVTLRDKSISVRGKPAEAVLAAWYPKLQGR